jgi:hypothetical protein
MRALFLVLVAANLALFAWAHFLAPQDPRTDPRPLGQQIEPGKLRIIPGDTPAPTAPPSPPPVSKPSPAPEAVSASEAAAACLEWGGFGAAEAARAEQALAPLALGARLQQRRGEETAGWWVYIPPQGSRQAAQKKVGELKALGVDEYFVMQEEGRTRWAISLGVFRSEEAAASRLEALRAKGVRSAQLGPRETQVQKVWFQLHGANEALAAKLKEIAAGFPGTELKDCP